VLSTCRSGAAHLRQALAIYQRIGAPAARRVQQTLQNHQLASTTPEPSPMAPPTAEAISPHRLATPTKPLDGQRPGHTAQP